MQKVFHFDSPSGHYVADAAVLLCIDQRFNLAALKFIKRKKVVRPDWITVAGGAKTLASPQDDFEQKFILDQIRISIRLHKTQRVILTCHSDCGAYGGLAAHGGDREAEAIHHTKELERAAEVVRANFPDVAVETYLINFDGVWDTAASEE